MHPLLALSAFPALLSTAQALVVHPLPRALTHTTTFYHGSTGPTPLSPFETDAAGHTILTVTFASATLDTSITPTPTGPVDHGSSALHNSDAEGHHGAFKRASGGDSEFGKRESGVSEPDATRPAHHKRCFLGEWARGTVFCSDDGLTTPSETPTPSKRDAPGSSLERRDLSAANQAPGVKERDGPAAGVDSQDKEEEDETARQLPRSPKKKETEEERESDEEEAAGMAIARSLPTPTQDLGVKERDTSARDLHKSDQELKKEELWREQAAEAAERKKEEEASAAQKAAAAQEAQAAQEAKEGVGNLGKEARQLPRSPKKKETDEEAAQEEQEEQDHPGLSGDLGREW